MKKRDLSFKGKILSLAIAAVIMTLGLILFKLVPMSIFGRNILFDASMHLVITVFILYVFWYFIDQDKILRIPYFVISAAIILVIAVQRIVANAHNDVGLLAGLVVSLIAIVVSRWDYFWNKFNF